MGAWSHPAAPEVLLTASPGRGQRDFNPRSRSDTLGEAKALCCLEISKISDPRGRRRPVKGSIQGVWEKGNIPWIGRPYYVCQEDLLDADATYSSLPWAGGHRVTGATKPHRHTVCLPQSCQVCYSKLVSHRAKTHQLHETLKLNLHC